MGDGRLEMGNVKWVGSTYLTCMYGYFIDTQLWVPPGDWTQNADGEDSTDSHGHIQPCKHLANTQPSEKWRRVS